MREREAGGEGQRGRERDKLLDHKSASIISSINHHTTNPNQHTHTHTHPRGMEKRVRVCLCVCVCVRLCVRVSDAAASCDKTKKQVNCGADGASGEGRGGGVVAHIVSDFVVFQQRENISVANGNVFLCLLFPSVMQQIPGRQIMLLVSLPDRRDNRSGKTQTEGGWTAILLSDSPV